MEAILKRSISEHRAALNNGEYSSVELTRSYLARIEACEPLVGAFLTQNAEGALQAAKEADCRRARGECLSVLDGIPYALKDNFCTAGLRTTCASRILEDFVPPYNATVVERLQNAGAILLGKLNMDEFAMGSTTETSALGVTRNPHDPDFVPGGSSGGSAAAVAAYEVPFSLGSDTGGSVRQPAAFCGVVGLKPTYGAISRYGMIALAPSLDCVGIVTHTADDCGAVLSMLVGKDPHDATSRTYPKSDLLLTGEKLPPLRVAVVRELLDEGEVSPAVIAAVERATEALRAYGAEIGEVSLPDPEQALAAYCVLSAAETSSEMGRYDGVHFGRRSAQADDLYSLYANSRAEGLGNEVKRRILFGTYMLSEEKRPLYYDRAQEARVRIRESLSDTLSRYDLILTPTTPTGAFRRGASLSPAQRRRADLCAVYANLAGLPAISIPFGKDENQMPLAVQLTAAHFAEELLLRTAKFLEEVRP